MSYDLVMNLSSEVFYASSPKPFNSTDFDSVTYLVCGNFCTEYKKFSLDFTRHNVKSIVLFGNVLLLEGFDFWTDIQDSIKVLKGKYIDLLKYADSIEISNSDGCYLLPIDSEYTAYKCFDYPVKIFPAIE